MRRLMPMRSEWGIWMRVAILNVAISGIIVLALRAYSQRDIREANNRTTCVSKIILGTIQASSEQAAQDTTISASARARADFNARFEKALIDGLRTSPRHLDCTKLIPIPQLPK